MVRTYGQAHLPMRAAIYARYSSDEQTGGESIDYQLERCREYIAKKGWSLDEDSIFIDEARSGTTTFRRDEFNRMVGLAKDRDRPFDVVVAWSTSRFGRDQDEAIFNKIGLRRHGVEAKFVSQPVPEGHIGTLIERIHEWKDEFDSIQIGEYAFQGQKQVTQKGFHGGGKAPYGYSHNLPYLLGVFRARHQSGSRGRTQGGSRGRSSPRADPEGDHHPDPSSI